MACKIPSLTHSLTFYQFTYITLPGFDWLECSHLQKKAALLLLRTNVWELGGYIYVPFPLSTF
jgi:hypothetical protein